MNVVVESLGGKIISDYCFKGWLGATNAGHTVSLTDLKQAQINREYIRPLDPVPIGSIEFMEFFFGLYGIKTPPPLQWTSNLTQVFDQWVVPFKRELKYPVFVKPALDVKKFTGAVFTKQSQWNLYPELVDFDGPYLCAKPFKEKIISEWRVFVYKGEAVNMSYYNGINPLATPSYNAIKHFINQYYNPPVAYSLDVCLLANGETEYIEVNDMWSIGSYGCDPDIYFKMLKDRWLEILEQNS